MDPIKVKTISVDFDGVLCDLDYPRVGKIKSGAIEGMRLLRKLGWYIIISSCRSCAWNWDQYYKDQPFVHASERGVFKDMKQFLDDNQIPYDEIDDGTKGKTSADYYLDDRAIRFENNWDEIMAKFINLEEQN